MGSKYVLKEKSYKFHISFTRLADRNETLVDCLDDDSQERFSLYRFINFRNFSDDKICMKNLRFNSRYTIYTPTLFHASENKYVVPFEMHNYGDSYYMEYSEEISNNCKDII